jgi:hypothetical protein
MESEGYKTIVKIGLVISSCKTLDQLINARQWYAKLCANNLWLHHHKIKFDFITVIKKRELK